MKSVLISNQPKWCELIASGKKTVEIRKTKPKLEVPFKAYIYCTDSGKDIFYRSVYSYSIHRQAVMENRVLCVLHNRKEQRMKVKKCPARKHCFDYKDNNCDNCDIGNEITKLHKRIDRLKKQNETLTIQRNAWALTAKALGEEKWISVDERLPENIGSYLVVVKLKYPWEKEWEYDVDAAVYNPLENGYIDHWNTWNDWNEGQECHITHWMPIPEAPNMKGGAE